MLGPGEADDVGSAAKRYPNVYAANPVHTQSGTNSCHVIRLLLTVI